jgi:predicted trehalose synthase
VNLREGVPKWFHRNRCCLSNLLEAYVIDKAFYELAYELNNRPSWV